MAFNKKRACCCGTTETDVAYFEVKSVVPIVAAEQVIDKTYSYWFRRENTTFVSGSVPDSTVLWERGSITNVNSEEVPQLMLALGEVMRWLAAATHLFHQEGQQ